AHPSAVRLDRRTTDELPHGRPVPCAAGVGERLSRLEATPTERPQASRRAPGCDDCGDSSRVARTLRQPPPVARAAPAWHRVRPAPHGPPAPRTGVVDAPAALLRARSGRLPAHACSPPAVYVAVCRECA